MPEMPDDCTFLNLDHETATDTSAERLLVSAGAGAHKELVTAALPRVRELLTSAAVRVVMLPLGSAGQLIWERLPWNVAGFVAGIRPEALIFACHRDLESLSHTAIGELLQASAIDDVAVQPALMTNRDNAAGLPRLAPRSQRLSKRRLEQVQSISGDGIAGIALKAGLHQIADDLHGSHEYSQSIEGEGRHRAGDYWHAIMHRREPDYGNSKYWFRHVGTHPLFPELGELAAGVLKNSRAEEASRWSGKLLRGGWDPFAFVDLCQQSAGAEESSLGLAARQIQWLEMLLLLDHTCRDAFPVNG